MKKRENAVHRSGVIQNYPSHQTKNNSGRETQHF